MGKPAIIMINRAILVIFFISLCFSGYSQRFLSDFDSSYFVKDTVRPILKRFENLRFSGYIQPQYQSVSAPGAQTFEGGAFSALSKSRFMLRRARIKIDYLLTQKDRLPQALFSFQIDATERGVVVRDMFLKLFEMKKDYLNLTMGLFARPFGYEVNLSSSFRETPERGRMSQILMPSERDLGLMVSYESLKIKSSLHHIKFDIGLFNGQGLAGTTDFDSKKDIISRLYVKPVSIGKWSLSGGLSYLQGGWRNATKFVYETKNDASGQPYFALDSSLSNQTNYATRRYRGADLQLKWKHAWGETEWRAEYWQGTQPGTSRTTVSPGSLPTENGLPAPTYMRKFNGAFLLFLQQVFNPRHQIMVKYDWYDPNTVVKGNQIGSTGALFTPADVRFNTLGIGYSYQLNPATRLTIYKDIVRNESTKLSGYTGDVNDNVFTCRLHFRF